jgi:hypothetical protein
MFSMAFEIRDSLVAIIEDLGRLVQIDINKETTRSTFFIW